MILWASLLILSGCNSNDDSPAAPPPDKPPERPQRVTAVTPSAQTISAARDTSLTMTFAEPLDPSSVDALSLYVFGRWSGAAQGAVTLEGNDTRLRFTPDKPFMAGEWITALLSDKLESAAGERLRGGYTWNFWTKAEPGSLDLTFVGDLPTRQLGEGSILSYGAYAGDLDGDGFSDLLIPNEAPNDIRVFMNDTQGGYGDGFTIYPIPNGSNPSPNEGADFNRDGILDVAVGNRLNAVVSVFLGTGGGQLNLDSNYTADQQVRAVCVLDANGDGFMDIATTNAKGSGGAGNVSILMNDGTGKFGNPVIFTTPGNNGEAACAAADANGDGLLDLFVGTLDSREILVLLGDGAGGLQLHSRTTAAGSSWVLAAGDLNGDGHADVVSANSFTGNLSVLLGDGAGNLSQAVAYAPGGGAFPLAVDLGDVDGDGDLDLIASNFPDGTFTLFENDGASNFINPRPIAAPQVASCAILHDRDNDGDLDFTGIDERDDLILLYRNGL